MKFKTGFHLLEVDHQVILTSLNLLQDSSQRLDKGRARYRRKNTLVNKVVGMFTNLRREVRHRLDMNEFVRGAKNFAFETYPELGPLRHMADKLDDSKRDFQRAEIILARYRREMKRRGLRLYPVEGEFAIQRESSSESTDDESQGQVQMQGCLSCVIGKKH